MVSSLRTNGPIHHATNRGLIMLCRASVVGCRWRAFMKLMFASVLVTLASVSAMAQPISPQTETKTSTVCAVEKSARDAGNGVTLDTVAIQKAIDDCASKGGGIVR